MEGGREWSGVEEKFFSHARLESWSAERRLGPPDASTTSRACPPRDTRPSTAAQRCARQPDVERKEGGEKEMGGLGGRGRDDILFGRTVDARFFAAHSFKPDPEDART